MVSYNYFRMQPRTKLLWTTHWHPQINWICICRFSSLSLLFWHSKDSATSTTREIKMCVSAAPVTKWWKPWDSTISTPRDRNRTERTPGRWSQVLSRTQRQMQAKEWPLKNDFKPTKEFPVWELFKEGFHSLSLGQDSANQFWGMINEKERRGKKELFFINSSFYPLHSRYLHPWMKPEVRMELINCTHWQKGQYVIIR